MNIITDPEIETPPNANRRRSIFNRTCPENGPNRTSVDIKENEADIAEEYCEEIEKEIESWKQTFKETKEKNSYLKGKLRAEEKKDYVDLDLLDEEEKHFILSAPDYNSYIKKIKETCNKAIVVAIAKQKLEKVLQQEFFKFNSLMDKSEFDLNNVLEN